jgi:hypothetical protein
MEKRIEILDFTGYLCFMGGAVKPGDGPDAGTSGTDTLPCFPGTVADGGQRPEAGDQYASFQ